MRQLDLVIVVVYLVAIAVIGLRLAGRQRTSKDYFVGDGKMPWWTVCFSVVATETSVLTVISIPGGAYTTQGFGNVELAVGYIIGRIVVATVLIPLYRRGGFVSAYQYLEARFGRNLQGLASITFVFTRLLAEGVRLFASAIPIKLLLGEFGVDADYRTIIIVLTVITVIYTYLGGIKAVIWTDAIQMFLYIGGAVLAIVVLSVSVGGAGYAAAADAGKFLLIDPNFDLAHILTSPFALPTAIIGGAIFAMASHGSDQLIVQRILATRSLRDSQQAMIGSGIFVAIQFAAFSLVGALLWSYNQGRSFQELGLATSDNLYPNFILHGLPVGISGLLVAGILGAAMGSLSSALNSMSNSTVSDIIKSFSKAMPSDATMLRLARVMTLVWAVLMAVFASAFSASTGNVYLTGLAIAGYTYGALLGAFLLGKLVPRANQLDAVIAFVVTLVVLAFVVQLVKIEVTTAGVTKPTAIAAQWLVPIGVIVTLVVGGLLSRLHHPPVVNELPAAESVPRLVNGELMAAEIDEQPAVLDRLLRDGAAEIASVASVIARRRPRFVLLAARGTSDHAALYAKYLVEVLLGLPAGLVSPSSTTVYGARPDLRDVLFLGVSQSGGSPDLVDSLTAARAGGALTVAVTNAPGSPLADAAELSVDVRAGVERAVAATKTYTAELLALYLLLAPSPDASRLADAAAATLAIGGADEVAARYRFADRLVTTARGFSYPTAREAALKLMETSYLGAQAFSAADLLHGPLAMIDAAVPVIAVVTPGRGGAAMEPVLERLRSRGADLLTVGPPEGLPVLTVGVPEELHPVCEILPLQRLALHVARHRGLDPDAPRGLAKVTRTR